MVRTWEHDLDQMIYQSGNDWLEYGCFGADTYGLHTELDGRETIIRIDAKSGKDATEQASQLLDRIAGGWRALNWRDDWYSITEAARILGVTRQRVHAMLQAGILEGRLVGHTWALSKESVNKRKAK